MVEPMETLDDECLAARVRSGGQEAFAILIRRYEQSLVALIRSRLGPVAAVEDVLQETFVQAWRGLASQLRGQARPLRFGVLARS